jgi:hypothetical protein
MSKLRVGCVFNVSTPPFRRSAKPRLQPRRKLGERPRPRGHGADASSAISRPLTTHFPTTPAFSIQSWADSEIRQRSVVCEAHTLCTRGRVRSPYPRSGGILPPSKRTGRDTLRRIWPHPNSSGPGSARILRAVLRILAEDMYPPRCPRQDAGDSTLEAWAPRTEGTRDLRGLP